MIKKQTPLPPGTAIRRVDAPRGEQMSPSAGSRRQPVISQQFIPASAGLACPGCDSYTEIFHAPEGATYPLVCHRCGAAGSLIEFGWRPKTGTSRPLSQPHRSRSGAT